jgi:hypothetical protein
LFVFANQLEPMRRESSSSPSTSSSRRYWSWPRSFSSRNNPPASTTESGIFLTQFGLRVMRLIFNHAQIKGVVEDAAASEPTAVETQVEIECESPDASALAISSSSTDSRSTNIV